MWIVYEHKNKINGKRYFGITSRTVKRRWASPKFAYRHNKHFSKAIEKYGWENFEHNIILQNVSKEEACYAEKYLIKWYNTTNRDYGYNLSTGGECAAQGVKRTCSEETRKKISQANKGKKRSEEIKTKMSESHKGRIITEETRKKISESHKGMKHTNESKKKISEVQKGKKISENLKQAISKKVHQISTDLYFNSMKEASNFYGKHKDWLSIKLRNKGKDYEDWEIIENVDSI